MKIQDLKANERNPRKISKKDQAELALSMDEFGDLSGIVFNVQSKRLVGGHQRTALIPDDAKIVRKNLNEPTKSGTVAEGYIELPNGERHKYREVDWDKKKETAAMIAANQQGGSWDADILKVNFADLGPDFDLALTGFDQRELEVFDIHMEVPEIVIAPQAPPPVVGKTTEQIETMNPNENVKVEPKDFDQIEEKKSAHMEKKRYVVIIDCKDEDHKEAMRDLIRPTVEQAEGKIF